jgi:hypothetical protein
VDAALTGFIGVAAGALTTGVVQTWIGSRQRRNDSLAAARLVYGSLALADTTITTAETHGQWGSAATRGRLFARQQLVWEEQRERLARVVDPTSFHIINAAFEGLRDIEETVADAREKGESDQGVPRVIHDQNHGQRVAHIKQAMYITAKAGRRLWDRPFAKWRQRRRFVRSLPGRSIKESPWGPGGGRT